MQHSLVGAIVASWSSAQIVETGVLIGLCALTLLLIILAWTRWGAAKTTQKCIWLSVFAHILLVIYAYETRLLLSGNASRSGEAVVPITLLAESETDDAVDPISETVDPAPPTENKSIAVLDAPPLMPSDSEAQEQLESTVHGEIVAVSPPPIAAPELLASSDPPSEPSVSENVEPAPNDAAVEPPSLSHSDQLNDLAYEGPAAGAEQVTLGAPRQSESVKAESPPTKSMESPEFRQARSSARPVAELYALRNPDERRANALKRGGTEGTEEAVDKALAWLASHQQTDGRWNPRTTEAGREFRVLGHDRQGAGGDADNAITGLALLALMGAGQTHMQGMYQDNIQRGLDFVLQSQSRRGDLAGGASLFAHMYSHGIATLAVSEAYALTGDERLKGPVERAVGYSLAAQDPRSGGWRYQPGEEGDMSQFGWQVMALKSAQVGGTTIPHATVQRMKIFLDLCSSGQYMGLASYRPRQAPSPTMTAEALACRYFLGQSVAERTAGEAAAYIVRQPPGTNEIDYYLWYYATLSLYQKGGADWEEWNRHLQRQLLTTQVSGGANAGSWEPNGKWCGYGGRVFSTALATMSLEVYYRYLPMLREQVAWENSPSQR